MLSPIFLTALLKRKHNEKEINQSRGKENYVNYTLRHVSCEAMPCVHFV